MMRRAKSDPQDSGTPVRSLMDILGPVVSPADTLAAAAEVMREYDRTMLPVCEPPALLGTIFAEDIQRRTRAQDPDPSHVTVREAMRSDRQYCFEDQDGGRIAQLMRERQIAHLVVLNREWVPVGSLHLAQLPEDEAAAEPDAVETEIAE